MKTLNRDRRGLALLVRAEREEAAQWRRFSLKPDRRTRESLFERYRRFARQIAARIARGQSLDIDRQFDLEQFAYKGLLEAIDRYDPVHGVPFLGFAKLRIKGSILDGMAQLDEFNAQQTFHRRRERERMSSLAAEPNSRRSAVEELSELVAQLALGLMLDAQERKSDDGLAGSSDSGFDCLAWRETRALLHCRVSELPEPEQTVIRQHYHNELLFSQIAALLGLSKGRVSQLHKSALEKLRKSMRALR